MLAIKHEAVFFRREVPIGWVGSLKSFRALFQLLNPLVKLQNKAVQKLLTQHFACVHADTFRRSL